MSVHGCLSLCGPVMDWRHVQGVPRLSPDDRWDRLQPPRDPTDELSGYRKWMDGWMDGKYNIKNTITVITPYSIILATQLCYTSFHL